MLFSIETLIGGFTIIVGIIAIFLTYRSAKRISNNDIIKYLNLVTLGMVFLLLFSAWHTVRESLDLKDVYGLSIEIPEYAFVALTQILLLIGALKVTKISKDYGFKAEGREMEKGEQKK